ncbi:MAG: UDP-N-acetylglucosamine--N-acetylmuramyl-(pentapeptide) pyrophosphoryl-undecaprenol N-acetylglucosamine transferase [Opitutaceae bacterium]
MSRFLIAAGGTGGHLAPGIALAEALRERGHECLILVSRKQVDARLGARYPKLRFAAMPGAGLGLSPLAFARFVGSQVRALAFCRSVFRREAPDAVVGFGGFTSAPAFVFARLRGVPSALHESNRVPGRAVRLLGRWANRVYLPPGVGLPALDPAIVRAAPMPVRREIQRLPRAAARAHWGLDGSRPLLVVLGGSQGASALNAWATGQRAFLAAAGVQLVVVTGPGKEAGGELLPPGGPKAVFLPFCDQMAALLSAADLVVSRAGAGTLAELMRCQTPALLVPFPQAADNHQTANAEHFARLGGAEVVPQTGLAALLPRALQLLAAPATLAEYSLRLAAADAALRWEEIVPDLEALAASAPSPASAAAAA